MSDLLRRIFAERDEFDTRLGTLRTIFRVNRALWESLSGVEDGKKYKSACSSSPVRGPVLLLVEDPVALHHLRARLSEAGFEVRATDDPQDLRSDSRPDIVLIDVRLIRAIEVAGCSDLLDDLRVMSYSDQEPDVVLAAFDANTPFIRIEVPSWTDLRAYKALAMEDAEPGEPLPAVFARWFLEYPVRQ